MAQVTLDTHRTKLMAWYQLFGYYACAGGALTCGFIVHYLTVQQGYSLFLACRWAMIGYSATKLLLIYLILMLSHRIEVNVSPGEAFNKPAAATVSNPITLFLGLRQSKGIVLQLSVIPHDIVINISILEVEDNCRVLLTLSLPLRLFTGSVLS